MAIKKQFLKSKPVCKVTFTVPAEKAQSVSVVGDFNKWNSQATELKKLKNMPIKKEFVFSTLRLKKLRINIIAVYIYSTPMKATASVTNKD